MKKLIKMFTSEKKTWLHTPFEVTVMLLSIAAVVSVGRYVIISLKGMA